MMPPREQGGLGGAASRGVWTTVLGQTVSISTQLVSIVVLSRLLSPGDYGLLAMVTAIVVIGEVIREFGLANASIQASKLSQQQRTNLFWLNTAIGLLCALLLFGAAPAISSFYSEPLVEPIAKVLAITFILGGLATQPRAHLARDLRFGALNVTDVAPNMIGLFVAVACAASGLGVWALVAQRLTVSTAMLLLALFFDRWMPGLPARTPGMGPLIRYGLFLVGTQLISSISRNIDFVVLGSRFGSTATGYYSRAFELVINTINQLNAPATKVAVPILSRIHSDTERHSDYLLRGQRALLFILVPLLGAGAVLAQPLVDLALGPGWAQVVPFVQILVVVAATDKVLGYATWWFALSTGRTDVTFRVTLVRAAILIVGVIIGSEFGPLGVALGYAAATTLGWLADLAIYKVLADAPSLPIFINAAGALLANAAPVLLVLVLDKQLAQFNAISHLALGSALYLIAWIAAISAIPPFRRQAEDLISLARRMGRR